MDQVSYVRLFADEDGASHIERNLAVGLKATNFVPPAPAIGVSELQPASAWHVCFRPGAAIPPD